jgi:D-alanyl-D-alanine carboxypeptidase
MKKYKNLFLYAFSLLIGISLLSYTESLSASQEGTFWEYNPLTENREKVQPLPLDEIVQYGVVGKGFDFTSDASYQKFLDDDHAFTTDYIPKDIVAIHSDFTSNTSANFQLRSEAATQFADMARAFSHAFNFKSRLSITSAYRSSTYQKKLASTCSTERCALPGTSEHEAGLALDLGVNGGNILSSGGKYYQRLSDNAHLRGFHNTYQKGLEIDGKMVEPRHRRYVGVELATSLHESGQTLAEYFYSVQ